MQGMLDPDILTIMMRAGGRETRGIREALPAIERVAERYYLRVCPALTGGIARAWRSCSTG